MRYLLSLALLVCGCTKANPDALPISTADLATPSVGGGGVGGSHDLAMSSPSDMIGAARDMSRLPPDMMSTMGVACGTMVCSGFAADCCINNTGPHCVNGTVTGCTNGPLFACDGPEDCPSSGESCCLQYSNSSKPDGSGCLVSCPAEALCHTAADCPKGVGYIACCPGPQGQYGFCSKSKC